MADFFALDFLLNGDSSDSDGDLVDNIILDEDDCHCEICRPRFPRVQNFKETVVDNYTDEQFQKNFR